MQYKLNTDGMTEDFFADTRLLGIIVSMKNYRFCWMVNHKLGYNFRLKTDTEIQLRRKGRDYFFPVYECRIQNGFLNHYIYQNQFEGEYLLPEFKHIDFLWLMKGDGAVSEQSTEVAEAIKKISGVQFVSDLTDKKIKNGSNLIL